MEDDTYCKAWTFDMSDAQVASLLGIIDRYPSGIGVINHYRFAEDSPDRGYLDIVPTEVK
jgi:hypothetical protein